MNFLVTGGAGFIGSAVCRHLIRNTGARVVNFDKLTYAASPASLASINGHPRYHFVQADVANREALGAALRRHEIDVVMHLAAESHVDRSIEDPSPFVDTNIVGTYNLLEAVRTYWADLPPHDRRRFRLHHVSTDEIYGQLRIDDSPATEASRYAPSSPYAASKAASDHLAMAWHRTYQLPVVFSASSNNFGPYHFPEKLVPLTILNAMHGEPLPVYGCGENVRDWLYVEDHARALELVATKGEVGRFYNIGGRNERTNLSVVEAICDILDHILPTERSTSRRELIKFVKDRPGHDLRYAVDPSRIEMELGWRAQETFGTGLEKTVRWFVENETWWRPIREKRYAGRRLGRVDGIRTAAK